MYRGKRYRIGGGSVKRSDSTMSKMSTMSTISENLSTISSATNPPVTSTPNEPVAGTSSVLTERNNVPLSQPSTSQRQPVIISNDDDDFAVPASQTMQPSRYISQRSLLMRSQSTFTQQTPMSYFESVLNKCGVSLTERNSDVSYTLNCDHLKFVVRLRRELTIHPKYPENIQTFLSGLIDTMKNHTQLTKVLSGCIVSRINNTFYIKHLINQFILI